MTDRELHAYLDGEFCGTFGQTSAGNLTFVYDDAYRRAGESTPLSLSMPLAAAKHPKRAVLPFLKGLLPDNEEALEAIGRQYSVSSKNPFSQLEHLGADVAGALQIVPPHTASSDRELTRTEVRPLTEGEIATQLDHVVSEYAEGVPYSDVVGRFSLAGAQPKIALHRFPDGGWGEPQDATPTTHILKPVAGEKFRRIDVVEQVTLRAAAALGNDVATSELVEIGDWRVLVSQRYDRAHVDGTWRRLHQEDLCQALSVSPDKKYQQRDGGPGLARIAELIRSFPFEADRRATGARFYRAAVFNIVAGCTDAHAKNYSLMLDGPSVSLAPLYDLLTYAAYWDGQAVIHSAMSVGGEYRFDRIAVADLVAAGRRFGLSEADAAEIVDGVRRGIIPAFEAATASISDRHADARAVCDDILRGLRMLPLVL